MTDEIKKLVKIMAVIFVAVLSVSFGATWMSAYFEARAYERLTGRHVSTWDAMWVELRVDDD